MSDRTLYAAVVAVIYLVLGRVLLVAGPGWRWLFAILSLCTTGLLFFFDLSAIGPFMLAYGVYVSLVIANFFVVRRWAPCKDARAWIAILYPVGVLIAVRVLGLFPIAEDPWNTPVLWLVAQFVGISYLCFRLMQLALEVRNGLVAMPDLWSFLAFAFFPPTFWVGPISPYSSWASSVALCRERTLPVRTALFRILVGLVKFCVLGPIFQRLTFGALWADGWAHGPFDFVASCVAYYLYIYCNFSGACDVAIAFSALMGFEVKENFDSPFLARNIKEFWNRWHISLSELMRDVVFTPLTKSLVRRWGAQRTNEAVSIGILSCFTLIGVWHGSGLNYLLFGLYHAILLIVVQYYTAWMKRDKQRFKAYQQSNAIKVVATAFTFISVSVSFFLFENSIETMRVVFATFR